jgi:class 3 adenylate cyclase
MTILGAYHHCLGEIVFRHGGTLERIAGDGLLVLFNDPIEHQDHPARAVEMALNMRDRMDDLSRDWRRLGHELGFGVGIAQGFVTVGAVGFDARQDYTVIGTTANLACRLCDEAAPSQILISQRVLSSLEPNLDVAALEPLSLKGFRRPVPAYAVAGWQRRSLT